MSEYIINKEYCKQSYDKFDPAKQFLIARMAKEFEQKIAGDSELGHICPKCGTKLSQWSNRCHMCGTEKGAMENVVSNEKE